MADRISPLAEVNQKNLPNKKKKTHTNKIVWNTFQNLGGQRNHTHSYFVLRPFAYSDEKAEKQEGWWATGGFAKHGAKIKAQDPPNLGTNINHHPTVRATSSG